MAEPAKYDFGTLPRGGHAEATFWLHNPKQVAVEIENVTTSCDCFRIVLKSRVVPSMGKVALTAKVDYSDDPNFRGSLRLEAWGTVKDQNSLAFALIANVKVQ